LSWQVKLKVAKNNVQGYIMTISVYVETKGSIPGHLVKFGKAKLGQGVEQIFDELELVGRVTLWIKRRQIHIEPQGKKYKVCLIKTDGCDIQVMTKNQLIKMMNEMMGIK
jgi:hypothetical protein